MTVKELRVMGFLQLKKEFSMQLMANLSKNYG